MPKPIKAFGIGVWVIIALLAVCVVSLFMPLLDIGVELSIIDVIGGKSADGAEIFETLGIYGIAAFVFIAAPLLIMLIANFLVIDRIKKYVLNFFLSVILFMGYLGVFGVLLIKFGEALAGVGFSMGLISIIGVAAAALVSTRADKIDKRHKFLVWYNGFNKIVLLLCVPLFTAGMVAFFKFSNMIAAFPSHIAVAIYAALAALFVSCLVSVLTLFAVYKIGILHFLTAICSIVSIVCFVLTSGVKVMIIGFVISVIVTVFWMFLGIAACKNFF